MGTAEGKAKVTRCHNLGGNQLFSYTKANRIMAYDLCLGFDKEAGEVLFKKCLKRAKFQEWLYNPSDKSIKSIKHGKCLTLDDDSAVSLETCNSKDVDQQWSMKY